MKGSEGGCPGPAPATPGQVAEAGPAAASGLGDRARLPVAVGSNNPTKVEAVRRVVVRAWPHREVVGVEVPSGVSSQPIGAAETLAGARHRAYGSLRARPEAWLGVGLEGGVDREGYLVGACCVCDREGRENVAWTARLRLPPVVVRRVLAGEELGPLLERLTGRQAIGRREGAVGLFSRGIVGRTDLWEVAVAGALMPWLTPQWPWFADEER